MPDIVPNRNGMYADVPASLQLLDDEGGVVVDGISDAESLNHLGRIVATLFPSFRPVQALLCVTGILKNSKLTRN